ncbi:MAG: high-affinity branched-chain amino acid ABC transporter ATP-binding protein LivG [Alteromonadaceae bacterium]|uniref:high-affinity branched-chain amino acid ABC transporter ATP-binding protein LivG n=1 Tax=unclassified Marinobacter TaxID=83889 RepID=UPI000C49F3FC|nr:high-affinity branched-chain amino acid ABC transporter ATP-binding protein LivG [Marinobacter sp. BGYM27]MAA65687.1 high-affinity branched-chain amino acid ABC transporter ATP-binding protein LivG [Alteromonadaceae bacterium]MBH86653.1 high-affinity branched-chain amino acid ABC transporter ATP-binding protein LivG [Alteromonadaceae bacterium]MDG5500798.1 high-affinity branched-chain amino acid ABC transporter ATP-binding protein LivG [Marinobacter sp. BGYM27]|tara:strand:- start:2306 stop:3061 length:756 start_codon:yes stop_codon:yes gene_type:complete
MLDVRNLSMRFGGLLAVDGVSLDVKEKEIVSIIGPNGAGKTTVFNCLSGFYQPSGGTISFEGKEIQGIPDYKISRLGLVRTFQHVRLFNSMTVVENLLVAQHRHLNTNLFAGLIKTPAYRKKEEKSLERAAYWLKQVGLLDLANREAGNLAYGQQRRLEIARCMVTEPRLLMLDEPAAGLNPNETRELNQLIIRLKEDYCVSVVLIEHDMSLVMDISDRINVINQGRPLASGTPDEIRQNDDVIKAYLGEE